MKICFLVLLACPLAAQAPLNSASKALAGSAAQGDPARELDGYLKQFVNVLSTVQSEAAEVPPVDKMVYEGAIPSMLRQLDPHTQFFDPGQFQQLKQMQDSEQKGFGSIVSVLPGQVIFLQTLPGTPSNKAGIQAGDELVAVNNVAIRNGVVAGPATNVAMAFLTSQNAMGAIHSSWSVFTSDSIAIISGTHRSAARPFATTHRSNMAVRG